MGFNKSTDGQKLTRRQAAFPIPGNGVDSEKARNMVDSSSAELLAALAAEEAARIAADAAIVQDKAYTHTQVMPSTTWTVTHNFGKKPNIRTTDSYGNPVDGDVTDTDENTSVITFYYLQTGYAYCS